MNSNLMSLPDEPLSLIVSHLEWSDIKTLLTLNQRFRRICKLNSFWKHKFEHEFETCLIPKELVETIPFKVFYTLKLEDKMILEKATLLELTDLIGFLNEL